MNYKPTPYYRIVAIIAAICIGLASCTYKKHGEVVKMKDGKFYRLEQATSNESYYLKEIDTSAINQLSK